MSFSCKAKIGILAVKCTEMPSRISGAGEPGDEVSGCFGSKLLGGWGPMAVVDRKGHVGKGRDGRRHGGWPKVQAQFSPFSLEAETPTP